MKQSTIEWIEKAEGDWDEAQRAHRYPGYNATKIEAKTVLKDCREVRRVIRTAFGLPV